MQWVVKRERSEDTGQGSSNVQVTAFEPPPPPPGRIQQPWSPLDGCMLRNRVATVQKKEDDDVKMSPKVDNILKLVFDNMMCLFISVCTS